MAWKGALLSLGGSLAHRNLRSFGLGLLTPIGRCTQVTLLHPPSPHRVAIKAPPPARIAPPSPGLTVIEAPPPYCKTSYRRTWIPICARVPWSCGLSLRWLCCARNASLLRTSAQARPRLRSSALGRPSPHEDGGAARTPLAAGIVLGRAAGRCERWLPREG